MYGSSQCGEESLELFALGVNVCAALVGFVSNQATSVLRTILFALNQNCNGGLLSSKIRM